MQAKVTPPVVPIQPTPSATHRRQKLWQIWVPMIVTILIVLGLETWAIIGAVQGSPQVDRWGAVSAVIVIIPVLFYGIIFLAIAGGLAFGVTYLLRKTPGVMFSIQSFMLRVALATRQVADSITKPVFATNTVTSKTKALWDILFHRRKVR